MSTASLMANRCKTNQKSTTACIVLNINIAPLLLLKVTYSVIIIIFHIREEIIVVAIKTNVGPVEAKRVCWLMMDHTSTVSNSLIVTGTLQQ